MPEQDKKTVEEMELAPPMVVEAPAVGKEPQEAAVESAVADATLAMPQVDTELAGISLGGGA